MFLLKPNVGRSGKKKQVVIAIDWQDSFTLIELSTFPYISPVLSKTIPQILIQSQYPSRFMDWTWCDQTLLASQHDDRKSPRLYRC